MPHRLIPTVNDKRGDFLLAGSAAFTAIGCSYVTVTTNGRSAAFSWLPLEIGPHNLGWLWIVVGLFGILAALLSRGHPRLEKAGYQLMVVPPMLWAVIFLGSWLAGAHALGWVSAISYSLMAGWILVVSDWPNPHPPRPTRPWRRPRDAPEQSGGDTDG